MDHELRYPLTDLADGSLLRLYDAQGRAIMVFEGEVWITQENDLRDVVLSGGESFVVERPGLTLVQAFSDSRLMVLRSGASPRWPADLPSSYELHRRARLQRSVAVGQALAKGFAALRRLLWPAAPRPTVVPATRLRVCH